ncbi:hypothetical protein P152DRAFT_468586 [Eremomyces bilateralis CBS 781.70]|uniref:Roadblock/LAMTOR2 domain-containing protein n=1 Tax=Eremomyces bilateralis CBS 781.70 TaxID=1392243 RepID=A0A6G1FTT0_9PEZI|nr:uncharacterized protein P152DRAFT_468586 [Eremomyces bilateralis CBS 781.70]KAF1809163.1 hypothetical protein P152DRAFT_468586 [Eremomyces bilateralis CBS 781.70]
MTISAPEETLALLTRLSQKPGVQSTLVLARDTGAIVRTSGLVSTSETPNSSSTLPASSNGTDAFGNGRKEGGMQSAEDVARLVYAFVGSAGKMIEEFDQEDEMKLLRVRTKKNELVIYPDAKYLLVVIHDTPPA